jgi:hypothetical protein
MNVANPAMTMKIHATVVTKPDCGATGGLGGNEGLVTGLECGLTHRG